MATTYSIKCVAVVVSGNVATVTVEQRNLVTDPDPLRTFQVVIPVGTSTASVVAAATAEVAAWKAAQDAAAARNAAATAEVTRLIALIGASTNITV